MTWFHDALTRMPGPDTASAAALRARADDILRPAGALSRLDDIAVHTAAWLRTPTPRIERPAGVVFAGDHGIAKQGVSAYPPEVTAAMVRTFVAGHAAVSVLARQHDVGVRVLDLGVDADLLQADALDRRAAAHRDEHQVAVDRFALAEMHAQPVARVLDARALLLQVEGDAALAELARKLL